LARRIKYTIPLELVELEEANYHITVKSLFPDRYEGLWIIDTGASKTVFNPILTSYFDSIPPEEEVTIRSAGIGNDHLDTTTALLHPFTLGNVPVGPMKVALIDLSPINTLYLHVTEREICGLIGSDFLMENRAVIDYARQRLTLYMKTARRKAVETKD